MWVLRHRLAVVLVAVAAFATAGVFTFALPQYRADHGTELTFAEAVPPSHGWRWDDPTPGFHLGEDGDRWNISLLRASEIPAGVGVLASARMTERGRPELIYAKNGCIGVRPSAGATRLFCPPAGPAVVIAYAGRPLQGVHPLFITGAVRGDVRRVVVQAQGSTFAPQLVYDSSRPTWWDTFTDTTSPSSGWAATVTLYGRRGKLASLRVRLRRPGEAIYCVSCR
jgi:hypothetical protein